MKTLKLFLVVVCVTLATTLWGQVHNTSWVRFSHVDVLNFTSFCRSDVAERVEHNILNGDLIAYRDIGLKNPLTVDEYYNLISVRETVGTVISNPDDPYTIIDTVVSYISGANRFSFTGKTSIEILCGSGAKVFVGIEPFKKLLDKRLTAVVDYFESKGLKTFSGSDLNIF